MQPESARMQTIGPTFDGANLGRSRPRLCRVAAVLASAVMLARLLASINTFSPTIDEPCHIGAAVSMVEAHKLVALVDHPPLARWVVAVPLWLDGARLPQCRGMTTVQKNDMGYALGTQVLYHSAKPFRTLLNHARMAMLLFPLAALFYLYRLATWLNGEAVAAASVVFFSVDPTLLGQGFWVCTDVPACAGFLAALYYGLRWMETPTRLARILAGISIGAAVALKFSCLFILPILAVLLWFCRRTLPPPRRAALQVVVIGTIAFVALWAAYAFNIGPLGDQNVFGHPAAWEHLPHWFLWTPVPMPSFFLGLGRLIAHDMLGQTAYLNGHVRTTGWWYYFPELLLIKEPIGLLLAVAVSLALLAARRQWGYRTAWATLVPTGLFLLISMKGHIDVGIRHLLPVIPLLYLFTCWQLLQLRRTPVLIFCIATAAVETAAVHPDYLSFFNIAAGGAAHGDRFAIDSNLDWNQDLYRLADDVRAHPSPNGYALRLIGNRNRPLLQQLGLDPGALVRPPHSTRLYISKDLRLLVDLLPWLRHYTPVAHVGTSIDVYDLPPARPGEPDDHPLPDDPAQ